MATSPYTVRTARIPTTFADATGGGLARAFAEMFPVATYRPVPRVDKTLFREEITLD
ncbi:hypothetical protein [uncultured Jannaschia sp.]|uniref:hypothetical protein n=1 Tax=uncultured Jannaschia sp. TaxID=293347 RepID=UPI00263137A7|nr:hypothetical protein [uncultured Jannaschia sp.]